MADDSKRSAEERWREHVAAWRRSALSQAEYCRREGLVANDFSRWKREIARRDSRVTHAAAMFVPVQVAPPPPSGYAFEATLRGGRVLRFGACVDVAALSTVVRALESGGAC